MNADDVITLLGLEPHPEEGGWFQETYRNSETTPGASLPSRYGGDRAHGTAIYYLLNATSISAMHPDGSGDGDALARQWPEHAEIIRSLATPPPPEN